MFSGTLPTLVSVIVSVTGAPGVVFTAVGLLVTVTASIVGHGERLGLRLGDRRIGRAGRRDGERELRSRRRDRLAGVRLQVDAEDSRLARPGP